jgi:hypothetical protein
MREDHGARAARFDRARLLRYGAAAAAPFVLGLPSAEAALRAGPINGRLRRLAAREKKGEIAWWSTFGGGYHYVPQRLLTPVAFAAAVQRRLAGAGVKTVPVKGPFDQIGVSEFRAVSKTPIPQILTKLFGQTPPTTRQLPVAPHYVLFGEPEYEGGPFGPPKPASKEDPFAPAPAPDAVRVAVIDTGYHPGIHPDLDTHVPPTTPPQLPDVTPHDSILDDEAAHGMFITGIIVRAAPKAIVENVRVLDGMGLAKEATVVSALARFIGRPEVSVINMSLGTFGDPAFPPIALAQTLALLPSTTAVVAAAGNNHTNQPMYPGAYKRAIAVAAAADRNGTPAKFSNFGPWVDCYAPGQDLQGAFDDWKGLVATTPTMSNETFDGWASWSGTSFAAPKVTGAIAAVVGPTLSGQAAADALVHDPNRPILTDFGRFLDL